MIAFYNKLGWKIFKINFIWSIPNSYCWNDILATYQFFNIIFYFDFIYHVNIYLMPVM